MLFFVLTNNVLFVVLFVLYFLHLSIVSRGSVSGLEMDNSFTARLLVHPVFELNPTDLDEKKNKNRS